MRAAWAAAVVLTLASIVDARGPARFRDPHILSEPSAWLLHGVAVAIFLLLAGSIAARDGQQLSRRAVALAGGALAIVVAAASVMSSALSGSPWGFPLADVVWTFDVLILGGEVVAFVLAIALGTPGCEIGVWRELVARTRRERAPVTEGLTCIVGIDLVDRWERSRRAPR